jgi:hypothetical protein
VDPTESSASLRLPTDAELAALVSSNVVEAFAGAERVLMLQGLDLGPTVTTSGQRNGAR